MDVVGILTNYANLLPLVSFTLLILAGCNFPISEDVVMIVSGAIAATLTFNYAVIIFIACFCGAFFGDVAAHCIGKLFSKRVLENENTGFMKKLIPKEKLNKAKSYFDTYGKKTLFFARFIPFGVRNVVFVTTGILKMPLKAFMTIDSTALLICMSITFSLGYIFSSNFMDIFPYINQYKIFIIITFVAVITFILLRKTIKIYYAKRNI